MSVEIRPLRPQDVPAADTVAWDALRTVIQAQTNISPEARARRGQLRINHLLETDPGGSWVAEAGDEIVGIALGIVREDIWGLSLFAVRADHQGQGIGRRLLDAAVDYGKATRGGIILSTADPRAMRRYARAGFALRPLMAAAGIVDHSKVCAPQSVARASVEEAAATIDRASRHVRGASHLVDIPTAIAGGFELLISEDRGFALHAAGSTRLLAATDEETAAELLRACLAAAPRGATVEVDFIAAGQDWAIEVLLDAGLALSPDGPLFVRGDVGPMRPYLPSGAYL